MPIVLAKHGLAMPGDPTAKQPRIATNDLFDLAIDACEFASADED